MSPIIEPGMRLEALDRQNPTLVCVATIADVKQGSLLIHFDGWGTEFDYWAEPDSCDLHPLGYMDGHGKTLQAPLKYHKRFDWATYLQEQSAKPVPFHFFTEEQKDGTRPDKTHSVCASLDGSSEIVLADTSLLKVGMRLEAVDRQHPTRVCVATVAAVRQSSLLLHFDGWGTEYDYWAEPSSPDLHPLGYSEGHGKSLQAPAKYNKHFDWVTYLQEQSAKPVPFHFFTEEQKDGTEPDKTLTMYATLSGKSTSTRVSDTSLLEAGMRLEALDRQNPTLICVATIDEVRQGSLLIHFDGWTSIFDYWAEPDSSDLHPLGYMEGRSEYLQTPNGELDLLERNQKAGTTADKTLRVCAALDGTTQAVEQTKESKPATSERTKNIEPGMRLEALDRQNPTLICVATVVEVKAEGQLLIHFDGWTNTYDYWAESDSPDLHPLGYMEGQGKALQPPNVKVKPEGQLLIHFDGWTDMYDYWAEPDSPDLHPLGYMEGCGRDLQEPNNYSKSFDWATYLREMSAKPVPFDFFTEEQKGGTEPDKTREVCSNLGLDVSGNMGSAQNTSHHKEEGNGASGFLGCQMADPSQVPAISPVSGGATETLVNGDQVWCMGDVPPAFEYSPPGSYRDNDKALLVSIPGKSKGLKSKKGRSELCLLM
ncbi:hypothetical protein BaRGS_00030602 [Batillaria attramentaria]|uniref:Uncharacterized protein n=1 Tax=Batillaria attramentaria TaxID=370345 RepID=A0ABD0JU39_9CAEN